MLLSSAVDICGVTKAMKKDTKMNRLSSSAQKFHRTIQTRGRFPWDRTNGRDRSLRKNFAFH